MLWNTFHKLILFHHIHFQVFLLTATPNLKINATATFQIICNLQKRTKVIMDQSGRRFEKNRRFSRSTSSPSEKNRSKIVGPQRTKSLLISGRNMEHSLWQSYPIHSSFPNYYTGIQNGFHCMQQVWNTSFHIGSVPNSEPFYVDPNISTFCSKPSSSIENQYNGNRATINRVSARNSYRNLPERKWEQVNDFDNASNKFVFTVMSYNVLAQDLIDGHAYLYQNHDKQALEWQVRWVNILKEIGDAEPDVICFQEVQESHLDSFFSILEKRLGYKSIYKKRTGIRTDGCAIYYKIKRLHLMQYEKVEYFQEDVPILNRDNVAIVARFVPKEVHTRAFVVATTHLLYNPKRQDVRLAQVQNLMAEVDKMAFMGTCKNGKASYLPIILTGDFNASPDSAVYEFVIRGSLDYENLAKKSLTKEFGKEKTGKVLVPKSLNMTDNCQYADIVKERDEIFKTNTNNGDENLDKNASQNMKFSSGTLSHPFSLKSAYNHISNGDVEGTTYQDRWLTVDYIIYSGKKRKRPTCENRLKLLSRYQLLTGKQLNGVRIPNNKLGSDHFSLIAKFSLE